MKNFNHLDYYGYPIYGKRTKDKDNSEFISTFWAVVVVVIATLFAAIVC